MLVVGLGDLIVTTWSFFGDWFFNVHTEVRLTWPATTYRAWTSVGALSTARGAATATLLNDGKVLVVGGEPYGDGIGPPPPAPAELFDPTTGEWTTTASPRLVSGWGLTATLLTDGRVLVVGGYADRRVYTEPIDAPAGAAEIYDPVSQKWTRAHDAPDARAGQTATRLLDGRVLLAGGGIGAGCTFTAEVYDPALDQWQATEDMKDCRSGHTATLLRDGRVFVAGGFAGGFEYQSGVATSETYDPRTGHWTAAAAMATNREGATATRLRDGRVLVVGGATYPTRSPCGPDSAGGCVVVPSAVASAELYDPASNSWQAVPPMHTARSYHGAVLLPDGRVLVIGGRGAHRVLLASAEIYDPTTKAWAAAPALHAARFDFEAVLLADGRVLASGGGDTQAELRGTEVLGPPPSGR
jgi:N-acetylneuraminic acid mutarotase